MKTEFAFNEICLDALREVGNIGLGNAITSLSTMINQGIEMTVPHVGVVPLSSFAEMAGGAEAVAACIYMPVDGDISGHVAFLLQELSAYALADQLLGLPVGTTSELDEIACSALMEAGNILAGSYMVAISDMTGLSLLASPPAFALDMTAAILASIASTFAEEANTALTILTRIGNVGDRVEGSFVFVPEPGSLMKLFIALGMENEANQHPLELQSDKQTEDPQANQLEESLSPPNTSASMMESRQCAA